MLGKMMCRQVPTLPIGGYATDDITEILLKIRVITKLPNTEH